MAEPLDPITACAKAAYAVESAIAEVDGCRDWPSWDRVAPPGQAVYLRCVRDVLSGRTDRLAPLFVAIVEAMAKALAPPGYAMLRLDEEDRNRR